jgi:hypothetical protein
MVWALTQRSKMNSINNYWKSLEAIAIADAEHGLKTKTIALIGDGGFSSTRVSWPVLFKSR